MPKKGNRMPIEMIHDNLEEAYAYFGRPVTAREWDAWNGRGVSVSAIQRRFLSWAAAWASIGVDLHGPPHCGYPQYRRLPAELKSKNWLDLAYNGNGCFLTPHSTHEIADHLDREQSEVWKALIALGIKRRNRGQAIHMSKSGMTGGRFPTLEESQWEHERKEG